MKITSFLTLLVTSVVGLTAWVNSPVGLGDGFLFGPVDTIPFRGVAKDTLGRLPGGIGWGNLRWDCQDSVRAGTGTVYYWPVTARSGSGEGTRLAAMDSADAHNSAANCHDIVLKVGGFYSNPTPSGRYDGLMNVRLSGQAASGDGVTFTNLGDVETRRGGGRIFEYFRIRNASSGLERLHRNRCVDRQYHRYISVAWTGSGNNQAMIAECATEVVELAGDTTFGVTAEHLLVFEPDSAHPTGIQTGATGFAKTREVLIYRNYVAGPGRRQPRCAGEVDKCAVIETVSYNHQNHAGTSFGGATDVVNYIAKEGPRTDNDTEGMLAWTQFHTTSGPNTLFIKNIQGEGNNYAVDQSVASMTRGANRVVGEQPGGDTLALSYLTENPMSDGYAYDTMFAVTPIDGWGGPEIDSLLTRVGFSRKLNADGSWTEWGSARDSIDTRAITEYHAGTGANHLLNTIAERDLGEPTVGTPPTDTDSDGLPDAYELGQCGTTTCIPGWGEWVNGRWAGDWYLNGCNLDGTLVGDRSTSCGGFALSEDEEIDPTFGAVDRFVYFVPVVTQYGISYPDFSSHLSWRFSARNPAGDTAMIVTCEANGIPADSATVNSRLVAWDLTSLNTALSVRNLAPLPGMEC